LQSPGTSAWTLSDTGTSLPSWKGSELVPENQLAQVFRARGGC
jgi:hypothetical protein